MICLDNITKKYCSGGVETQALSGVDLLVDKGELLAVMGRSGSGKTTLLNILGGVDSPTSGSYFFDGKKVDCYNCKQMEQFRKENISFIFQNFELMDNYTVFENVEMPLIIRKIPAKKRKQKVENCLESLEIAELLSKYPKQLSGGQKQRVAIARALVTDTDLILADEPTGSLDETTGQKIMDIFRLINDMGKTVIIVTHDQKVAEQCDRIVVISDGVISQSQLMYH